MTNSGHTGRRPAPPPAPHGVDPARPVVGMPPPSKDSALPAMLPERSEMGPEPPEADKLPGGQASPTDSQRRIAQLLGNVVDHLISAGLDLASVRARLPHTDDHIVLEHATNHVDTALIDIRRLAVRVGLASYLPGREALGDREPE
jgi:hypothetical protein